MTKSLITLGFGIALLASSSSGMAYLYCGDYNNSLCSPGSAAVSCQWHNGNKATCTCKDQGHAYAYSCASATVGNKGGGGQASTGDVAIEPEPFDIDALLAAFVAEPEEANATSSVPAGSKTAMHGEVR